MAYTVKIQEIYSLTYNVKQIKVEKPKGYSFIPGQATEVAINKDGWKDKKRPFTFTSLPDAEHLEFVIKSYRDHNGVTNEIDGLVEGDEFLIDDAWGAIQYKGLGVFIAGGAGVTPFIGILRALQAEDKLIGNKLIFANRTGKDVILETYFQELLGENFTSIIADEKIDGHEHGMINMEFLKTHVVDYSQQFYVCGPDQMIQDITTNLEQLGASPEGITFEK